MKVPFVSVALNEGQQKGLELITDWLSDPNSPQIFRLRGRAGTGKSVLVAAMYNEIEILNQAMSLFKLPEYLIHLTATTNQAAEELNTKIKEAEVVVIHSYLSLTVFEYEGESNLRQRKNTRLDSLVPFSVRVNKNPLLIVIDEASYVGDELLPYIKSLLKDYKNIKVMYVYDHKQLLPVNEDTCLIDVVYNDTNSLLYELTENERFQSYSNSAIAVAADNLCSVIGNDDLDIPDIEEGEDLQFITSEEAMDVALNHFKEGEYRWNSNHMLYVAHTNINVVDTNEALYEVLNPNSDHYLTVSGMHLVNNSIYQPIANSPPQLRNNQKVTVLSLKDNPTSFNFHGVDVVVLPVIKGAGTKNSDSINVTVAVNPSAYLNALKSARTKAQWDKFYPLKNQVCDLRLSYGSTVYKSQGKSCNYVMVDVADILDKSRSLDEAKRLLYVAITRARKKVYLIWD